LSKKTEAVSAARGAAKGSGAHLTKQARMSTMERVVVLIHAYGYQVSGVGGLREKHIAVYIEARKKDGLSVRTLQNEMSHVREAMRAVGRHQAADSPSISNEALGISGSCRDGTKVAASDDEYEGAVSIAADLDEGLAVALKLQRWLGLRSAESIRCAGSLEKWEQDLVAGKRVTVISGTKGGRRRETRPADVGLALEAVREALAVVAKRRGKLINKPSLREAMTWYRNIVHRRITDAVGIQAHALRYAYACDMLDLYHAEGFSKKEAEALTSIDLGHGDGRGRYVRRVYGRRGQKPDRA